MAVDHRGLDVAVTKEALQFNKGHAAVQHTRSEGVSGAVQGPAPCLGGNASSFERCAEPRIIVVVAPLGREHPLIASKCLAAGQHCPQLVAHDQRAVQAAFLAMDAHFAAVQIDLRPSHAGNLPVPRTCVEKSDQQVRVVLPGLVGPSALAGILGLRIDGRE